MFGVALFCIACAAYWWWSRKNAKTTEPPCLPGAWPLLGHAPLLLGNGCNLWNRLNDFAEQSYDLGGVVSVSIGPRTIYIVTDPDDSFTVATTCHEKDDFYDFGKSFVGDGLVTANYSKWKAHRKVLNPAFSQIILDRFMDVFNSQSRKLVKDLEKKVGKGFFDHYACTKNNALETICFVTDPDDSFTVATTCHEKDDFYDFGKSFVGDGLVTANYSKWKAHRKVLNPAFSQIILDRFMDVFNSQSRKLVKDLEKKVGKGFFDHYACTKNNALETICLTALGVEFTDLNVSSKYMEALQLTLDTFLERFVKFWWHSPYTFAWSSLKRQQDASVKILHNISNTVLQSRKSEFSGNICNERSMITGFKFKSFLDLLLELSVEKGVFNDKEVREHVDTMIVAGHDTVVKALIFTITLLGSYPEIQEKVFTEIKKVLKGDKDVEKSDLLKLVYLEAVLKESMRVFTIVPIIARKLDRDVKLKNCTLSAGRTCACLLFGIHKHPIWGPDVHEFIPERWLEPGRLPDNPKAFAAFSLGKRHCIGKAYAMMSMKTTLAHVVRRYKIKADHTKMRLTVDIMLKPDSGHHISIETRT